MAQFLEAWKLSQKNENYEDSYVYPEAFISDEEKKLQEDARKEAMREIRLLSMKKVKENNDDQWFI